MRVCRCRIAPQSIGAGSIGQVVTALAEGPEHSRTGKPFTAPWRSGRGTGGRANNLNVNLNVNTNEAVRPHGYSASARAAGLLLVLFAVMFVVGAARFAPLV